MNFHDSILSSGEEIYNTKEKEICYSFNDMNPRASIISTTSSADERPSSRASTTSSKLTREEVSFMSSDELEEFCRQVFTLCDANGDGFITQDELVAQCDCDDPELMDQIMTSMDTDNDGRISFEEFRSGIHTVSKQLTKPTIQSTPDSRQGSYSHYSSRHYQEETVYESDATIGEKEEAWQIAMSRVDPNSYISNNEEVCSMWMELYSRDPALLERFEGFLTNVVTDLERSQSDVEHVQNKIKKLLNEQNREAHEMDGILREQLMEAYDRQEKRSQEVSERISTRYKELLAEREALIASLSEKEQALRHVLEEKTHTEQELRRERLELLNLNQSLKDQLSDSYKQLTASQKQLQRLSRNINETETMSWLHGEEPLIETSITDSLPVSSSRGISVSPQLMPSMSPPSHSSPSKTFNSPSLAAEVEAAIKRADTPTLKAETPTNTPTPTEEGETEALLVDVQENEASFRKSPFETRISATSMEVVPSTVTTLPTIPSSNTPVHYSLDQQPSFTVSQLISPRENNHHSSNGTPSRVFKVVILGDSGVGKTSLVRRLSSGEFQIPRSTLGLDYSTSIINVGEETVVFQLWDTAGQERFQSTTAVYFRRADAFIIVYDVTNKLTFKSIKSWISLVKATLRSELPVLMIMGNKSDCDYERKVSKEEGQQIALELRALFSETSALSGDNVVQAHTTLASLLLERENQDMEAIKRSALRLDKIQERKSCRC